MIQQLLGGDWLPWFFGIFPWLLGCFHPPNRRTKIFFRGVNQPPTRWWFASGDFWGTHLMWTMREGRAQGNCCLRRQRRWLAIRAPRLWSKPGIDVGCLGWVRNCRSSPVFGTWLVDHTAYPQNVPGCCANSANSSALLQRRAWILGPVPQWFENTKKRKTLVTHPTRPATVPRCLF